ncbi:hypothetical protein Tco_0627099 [Tanacetum coccineum]|uniref:Uncharacterized protein n=1 Tax=Tanacetum coccineum TaxID=301880 RepID=A0ABQ4WLJ9_9ASTR
MDTTRNQQKALDDELVAPENLALDALKLTPFYNAFEITIDVPEIYIDMLKICPKLPGQEFEEPSLEEEILSFIRDLRHISEAYMTYLAYATGEKTPKPKSTKNKADSESSPKTKLTQASKGKRIKTLAKGGKPAKKKQSETKSKGLTVLSEAALTEAENMKIALEEARYKLTALMLMAQVMELTYSQRFLMSNNKTYLVQIKELVTNQRFLMYLNTDHRVKKNLGDLNVHGETQSDDDGDNFVHPNLSTYKVDDQEKEKEEEKANDDDEVSSNQMVSTPPDYEISDEEENQEDDDNVIGGEQENEEDEELYGDLNLNLDRRDAEMVSSLETELFELKQTNQFAEALSSIPGIIDNYLASQMKDAVNVAVQLKSNKLREEDQAENDEFLKQIDSNIKAIIKDQRGRDDQDKDEEPSAGLNQGTKRKRSSKEESSKEAIQKESKSTSSSKVELEYHLEEVFKPTNDQLDWHNPEGRPYPHDLSKPLPLIQNARSRQVIPFDYIINNDLKYLKGGSLSKKYTTSLTKTKDADYGHIKWIENKRFYGYATNMETSKDVYSRHRIIAVTSLKIMKFFGYKHLEEITVRRQDDQLYRRIVIQERMEDLQLAVESYQKKINLSRPDSYHLDLRKMTPYTTYHNIQGIIYQDDMDKNHLMHTDELHKFSDGTLNHVRTALNDIAIGIQMEYLPKRKRSKQDKQRARVMINAIDKKLRDRRLTRSLEKFVCGRPYGGDLWLL